MWDQRYSSSEYAYGTAPNDFLAEHVNQLPKGNVLCLAEGEGRNAVFLAEQGFAVTAVDSSQVGLEKAKALAAERQVSIDTIHTDLAEFEFNKNAWDAIVSIFCHLPSALRVPVHRGCVSSLKPDGVLLLEAYTPAQLKYKTGGPPLEEMMMSAACLREELVGLTFMHLEERVRDIHEGKFHNGAGAVVQVLAKKL